MNFDVNPATCQWGSSANDQNGIPYNPDETNIMAYSHVDCQNHFSAGQGQLMRNIIANLQLLQDCLIPTLANPSITASPIPTTWSATEYRVSGTLNIESGATLIISAGATVRFAQGSKVVINPNAKLILEGKLTSFCDHTWKGVEVWGNSNASQVQQGGVLSQGKFIGRAGSVVENAETGAQLWGPDFTGAGGQIVCTGTTFKNNIIGINAAKYQNFWPLSIPPGWLNKPLNYVGSFTGCNFETNNEYPHSSKFFAFANLQSVNGFQFSGCHFENAQEHQDCYDISDFGFGIFAQNAGFTVNGQCLDIFLPCANYNRSLFKGLGYGIHTQNLSQNRPYIVEMADFEDCFFGIYQNKITGATVVGNNFRLGNLPNTDCTTDQIGAVLSLGTMGITFQENKFLKVPGNVTKTVGTYSIELGLFDNIIRRNIYDGITYGNIAAGKCGNSNPISTGLLYECNKNFNIEQYDFIVQRGTPGQVNAFIRRIQGSSTLDPVVFIAAGNKFSYTGIPPNSDFLGQGPVVGDFTHDYYYNPVAANEKPLEFGLIIPKVGEPNACAPEYCIPPCMDPYEVGLNKARFYTYNHTYQLAKTAYQSAVNAGNQALAKAKANEAGYARQEMDKAAHMVLLHTMYDTVTYNRDTLRTWLSNVNYYDSEILLSNDYLDANLFAQAQYVLNQIPVKFNVTANDLLDLQSLSSIYSMIEQNTLLGLDENDLASLSVMAHSDLSYSTNLARGILELYQVEFFHPKLYDAEERWDSNNQGNNLPLSENAQFKVFPNPTSDILFISGDITGVVFKLTNVSGGTVLLKNLTGDSQQQSLAVNHLPDGLYFYEILAKNGKDKLQHGKIVIKK